MSDGNDTQIKIFFTYHHDFFSLNAFFGLILRRESSKALKKMTQFDGGMVHC